MEGSLENYSTTLDRAYFLYIFWEVMYFEYEKNETLEWRRY